MIFELISSLTPSLVAYVSLVISVLDTLMSVFVASPELGTLIVLHDARATDLLVSSCDFVLYEDMSALVVRFR